MTEKCHSEQSEEYKIFSYILRRFAPQNDTTMTRLKKEGSNPSFHYIGI